MAESAKKKVWALENDRNSMGVKEQGRNGGEKMQD